MSIGPRLNDVEQSAMFTRSASLSSRSPYTTRSAGNPSVMRSSPEHCGDDSDTVAVLPSTFQTIGVPAESATSARRCSPRRNSAGGAAPATAPVNVLAGAPRMTRSRNGLW